MEAGLEQQILNPQLAMGIFAFYVVGVSLLRLLSDREFFRLTAMKKAWGSRRGLLLHFLANVGLPLVLGVVFMSKGIVQQGAGCHLRPLTGACAESLALLGAAAPPTDLLPLYLLLP